MEGTSPELRMLLMSSTNDSSLICVSEKRNTVCTPSAPAAFIIFFRSSRHSTLVYDLEISIWKVFISEMCAARRDRLWRPEPPTPASNMCAPGCLSTRQMRETCSTA